jgi:hypothetical protein
VTAQQVTLRDGSPVLIRHAQASVDPLDCDGWGNPRRAGSENSTARIPESRRTRPCRQGEAGHNRKTDAHDAHAVTVVAVRTGGLQVLAYDDRGAADIGRPPA